MAKEEQSQDTGGSSAGELPVRCEVCGGSEFVLLFKGNIGRNIEQRFSQYAYYDDIYRCSDCGLLAQRQSHDHDAIVSLLKSEKYLDEAIGQLNLKEKQHQFRQLIDIIRRHGTLNGARVLDVGANTGVFLNMLREYTPHLRGIEPSVDAVAAARKFFDLDIQNGVIAELASEDESFDVITIFDVIEHLTHPARDLAQLLPKLRRGGRIYITTHDSGTLYARLWGSHYPMLMYQHFFHFSPKTLARLLERVGYRVVARRHFAKSWSLAYFAELFEKKWPGTLFSKMGRLALAPVLTLPKTRSWRLVWPIREFFMMVAERP
jgi:2-polyprenyl-3-methyl-5-hydroxy-6-metoxy-1,4-benzoquinol methylase